MPDSTAPYPSSALPDAAEMRAGAVLSIDLGAIQANWRLLQARLGSAACAAVLKADAYGLGAAQVAPALAAAGCENFFVAHLHEGIALRAHVPAGVRIHVLHGCFAGTEAECAAHDLIPVLNSPGQLAAWAALSVARGRRLPALIQIDTGMARFGFTEADLKAAIADGRALAAIDPRGVMSHLACADEPGHPANAAQRARFDALRALLPPLPASLSASSGIFLGPDFHYQMARPGAALYGVNPSPGEMNPMRPVVRLDARVIQLRDVPAGTPVGYGHTARTAGPARLATIAVGYADGYPRAGSNTGAAWFAGVPLPVLGRVSMDSIILDASALPEGALHEGALVTLIGPQRDIDAVGADCCTIGYEILTSLGRRYHRRYIAAEA